MYEWMQTSQMCYACYTLIVSCPSLTDPNNGMVTCSLGDDGVPSYEDICIYKCNTGYKRTNAQRRNCQSNGIWSGSDDECIRGM